MVDATVSVVVELLLSTLKEKNENEIQLVMRSIDMELDDLSRELTTIRNVLEDAERKQFTDKSVKDWLWRLEQTSYEMVDVLEEWNYDILKHKMKKSESVAPSNQMVCSFLPSSCFSFNELVLRLHEILKEKGRYNFVISEPSPASQQVQYSTSLVDLAEVHGRSYDRDKLVSKLCGSHLSYHIVSIVGAEGTGKTGFSQQVYHHSLVKESFDYRIWICVSDPFDVVDIAKGIIKRIDNNISPDATQLDVLLDHLISCISGKKIILFLDDVWNIESFSDEWKQLETALKCIGATSRILVTARDIRVAKNMGTADEDILRPGVLSEEECWLLLSGLALSGKCETKRFEEIGKGIAKKCNGLPPAAKTLGSLLHFKTTPQEWEKVLKCETWELEQVGVELFPHLLLSYQELSPMLKQCFSFCAFFPIDKNLMVDVLIGMWMALGYLGSGGDNMELKGRECFKDLAMRSLFQDFKVDDVTKQIISCKMHNKVHDFAKFLRKAPATTKSTCHVCDPSLVSWVKEYHGLSWVRRTPPSFNICDCLTSLRVLEFGQGLFNSPRGMEKLIHLRWLDMSKTKLSKEDMETICMLYFLQTLLLARCSLKEIPTEIVNLVLLRHLDLSDNYELKELPKSICSLYKLQTLLLVRCNLQQIPMEIGNLVQLRHLDLSNNHEVKLPESICSLLELQTLDIEYCSNVYPLPEGVAQLSGLRTLCEFRGGSGWNKLALLKNLNRLTGSLKLYVECNNITVSDLEELVEDAQEAELRNKIHLQDLDITFLNYETEKGESDQWSSALWADVIEALQPNHKLKHLTIRRYEGSRLPHWISLPLNHVRNICLYDCSELSSLSSLGKLPFLERLHLGRLEELKLVGGEWLGIQRGKVMTRDIPSSTNVTVVFPKLKDLEFDWCSKWERWEDITEEEEESAVVSIMPCLTHLKIMHCRRLKMLPHRLLQKAQSLKELNISESSELIDCYGDKNGSPWRSISQVHPQLKLITHNHLEL